MHFDMLTLANFANFWTFSTFQLSICTNIFQLYCHCGKFGLNFHLPVNAIDIFKYFVLTK